jgi:N utilization substance protein B
MKTHSRTPVSTGDELTFLRVRRYARAAALRFLYQADQSVDWRWDEEQQTLFWDQATSLDDALEGQELKTARTFANWLIAGVIAHRADLDREITARATNWRLERMGAVDRNLLRLCAFEILYGADKVPPVAAINEAIELAKEFGDTESPKFINGILDRLHNDQPQPPKT